MADYPYKISTLIYCFNDAGQILLLRRAQEPNRGLWSPPGGKLQTRTGESPYACACREGFEEMGVAMKPEDLHLTGLVSEFGYLGAAHWLMFLFELRFPINELPPPNREGEFGFFTPDEVARLPVPETDRESIWPWFWRHRGGFFAAHCHYHEDGRMDWTLEQSTPAR